MRRPLLLALVLLVGCVTPARQQQAASRIRLGTAYLREGDAASAIPVLREATTKDPRNWEAWDKLALAYMAQGDQGQSERAFKKGVKLVPDKAEINNNYGLLLMAQGRNEEAIAHFTAARADLEYRRPALVLNNLSRALLAEGRTSEALDAIDGALERSPKLCQAHLNRGHILEQMDRLDGALESYEQVVSLCGDSAPGGWFHASKLLLSKGDRVTACAYLGSVRQTVDAGSDFYDEAEKLAALECP